ncbi:MULTISPECIES: UDP-N-acetylmuramoyl-tripeptide--D-alanyl-D-alanine ligase [Bacillus]|uniref:UDP-N-acetylmuramoyl-tripeptide--D-alanyl-D- alanine ligase n=1 Tax=Bacillus TaxID=1386 RepID=UPI0003129982|nr:MULTISPECIES: UDP-N-acetylmuramoyl-tripeptide--D-alanyl-D-alanine ligase [Bacillus]
MIKRTLQQIAVMIGLKNDQFQDVDVKGVTIDSRKIEKGQLFIPFKGENSDGHKYVEQAIENGAAAALWQKDVPNPPVHLPILLVDDTLTAIQQLAKQYLNQTTPQVIGITGSNGKTTTKDMTASLLSQKYKVHKTEGNFNNHLGLPLTILSMPEDTEVVVLEMGMSSKGEIELLSNLAEPDLAIITNIGESHLLDLGSREAIAEAKLEIVSGLKEEGLLVYNGDEPLLQERLVNREGKMASFGKEKFNTIYPLDIETGSDYTTFTSNLYPEELKLPILGNHNVLNAMAAILVARELGVSFSEIKTGLQQLKVTNMRMEMLEGMHGAKIINDAYNASPTAMRAAIDLVSQLKGFQNKYLVLGDMLELGDDEVKYHQSIGEYIQEGAVHQLFTYGQLGAHIAEGAKAVLGEENVQSFLDKQHLINELKNRIGKDDLILVKASRGMKLEEVVHALQIRN